MNLKAKTNNSCCLKSEGDGRICGGPKCLDAVPAHYFPTAYCHDYEQEGSRGDDHGGLIYVQVDNPNGGVVSMRKLSDSALGMYTTVRSEVRDADKDEFAYLACNEDEHDAIQKASYKQMKFDQSSPGELIVESLTTTMKGLPKVQQAWALASLEFKKVLNCHADKLLDDYSEDEIQDDLKKSSNASKMEFYGKNTPLYNDYKKILNFDGDRENYFNPAQLDEKLWTEFNWFRHTFIYVPLMKQGILAYLVTTFLMTGAR